MVSETLHAPVLNGRTMKSSSSALVSPFSRSELFTVPLLSGSSSPTMGDLVRFFRLSVHVAYKYSANSNTSIMLACQQDKKSEYAESGRTKERTDDRPNDDCSLFRTTNFLLAVKIPPTSVSNADKRNITLDLTGYRSRLNACCMPPRQPHHWVFGPEHCLPPQPQHPRRQATSQKRNI